MSRLALGLDSSTQSLTAVLIDIDRGDVVYERSLDYRTDQRFARFDIDSNYILPGAPGEANQPAQMYLVSLEAIFADLRVHSSDLKFNLSDIAVVNVSAQQHGHVLLNAASQEKFESLNDADLNSTADLSSLLADIFAVPFARIWKTSSTAALAAKFRQAFGGKERIIEVTGSDAPWRFSAFGIAQTALEFPQQYQNTRIIHQISSLIPAVLLGSTQIPLDFGNACGTSLMHYTRRQWSDELIRIVGKDLPGGPQALARKLPDLASGLTVVGKIARYFVRKYGLDPRCLVGIGSGDNPQTKVLISGSLLSLGSSFVNMVDTDGQTMDMRGYTNAMYDALDRPFMFGCRVNGALCWDKVRALHSLDKKDYQPAENALTQTPPGNKGRIFIWHPDDEAFPPSAAFDPVRYGYDSSSLPADYAGVVESSLGSIYLNSEYFMAPDDKIYVAGGPTSSPQVLRRIAAIWNRNVIPIEAGGAALGAAVSGACACLSSENQDFDRDRFCDSFLRTGKTVAPDPQDIAAYHCDHGYLSKLKRIESDLINQHPI